MTDITEFIRARLDEDEQTARATTEDTEAGRWSIDPYQADWATYIVDAHGHTVAPYEAGSPTEQVAAHIARHDPDRVLRGVEAKRRLIAGHIPGPEQPDPDGEEGDTWRRCYGHEYVSYPCSDLRDVASEWSDHPDYRQEWAPVGRPD